MCCVVIVFLLFVLCLCLGLAMNDTLFCYYCYFEGFKKLLAFDDTICISFNLYCAQ